MELLNLLISATKGTPGVYTDAIAPFV